MLLHQIYVSDAADDRPVEGEPLDVLAQNQTRRHEELGEVQRVDSFLFMLFELQTRVLEQVYGVLGVHVFTAHIRGHQGSSQSTETTVSRSHISHLKCQEKEQRKCKS